MYLQLTVPLVNTVRFHLWLCIENPQTNKTMCVCSCLTCGLSTMAMRACASPGEAMRLRLRRRSMWGRKLPSRVQFSVVRWLIWYHRETFCYHKKVSNGTSYFLFFRIQILFYHDILTTATSLSLHYILG